MSAPYYETSRDAERAFYAAFRQANLEEMMQVWADDDSIMCIHPMGPRLDGRAAVTRSWSRSSPAVRPCASS
jgi:ketosteroid isomerase-like protein